MKSFLQLNEEKQKSLAMLFGRMNPPTAGHEENVEGLKKMAKQNNADHLVVASHSHDAKKNPLDPKTKLKHLKRAFPDTNITTSSKEQPTIMHQAAEAHKKGYNHLIIAGGGDRVKEYHHLLNKYNGVEGRHGYYKFHRIEVKSTGERKAGISGTDMRKHVENGNFNEFRKHLPSHIKKDQGHSLELFKDVGKGMGLHESTYHGNHKAIFVTGGPGSGKDVVIRECIAEQRIVELNLQQVTDILNDKHKLAMRSMNPKMEAVRRRGPLIINGPADDHERISQIKEELEELGYKTMMVFVQTTNEVSQERNTMLTRMMTESIRRDKWEKANANKDLYESMFSNFVQFDNNADLEDKIEDISETFTATKNFMDAGSIVHTGNIFLDILEAKKSSKDIQRSNLNAKDYPGSKLIKDNNAPSQQIAQKMGKQDDVRDGDVKSNSTYAFRTYAESNFSMDADKTRRMKRGDKSLTGAKVGTPDGLGSTFDSRATTGAAGAGLGNQTYSEAQEFSNDDVANFSAKPRGVSPNPLGEKKSFKSFIKKEAIDSPGTDSGLGGTLGGASNKEPMVTPLEKFGQSGITIKKKPGAK
jgi:nicotinamide mononucleotide adenylyltransferase